MTALVRLAAAGAASLIVVALSGTVDSWGRLGLAVLVLCLVVCVLALSAPTAPQLVWWGSECVDCGNATHASMCCDACYSEAHTVPLFAPEALRVRGRR